MSTPKKIIFLVPILAGGGGEKVVSDLTLHLPNTEKVIVAFQVHDNHFDYQARVISLHIGLSTNPLAKALIFLKGLFAFSNILAKEKPDAVISFGSLQNIINVLVSKNSIIRVDNPIVASHQDSGGGFYPLLVRLFFNRAKHIVVVSAGLKAELVETFHVKAEKITIIYNAVDPQRIRELAEQPIDPQYQEPFKHPAVITIGKMIKQKGQWHLVKAFAEVKKEVPDAELVILGDGPLRKDLQGLIEKLGLQGSVHLLGWQKNPYQFLARSTVFALPSLWEGFAIVVLEAMACGVPVVASDCDFGPKEIINSAAGAGYATSKAEYLPNGILVPSFKEKDFGTLENLPNEKILADSIVQLLKNPELRQKMSQAVQQRVNDFSLKSFIDAHQRLY